MPRQQRQENVARSVGEFCFDTDYPGRFEVRWMDKLNRVKKGSRRGYQPFFTFTPSHSYRTGAGMMILPGADALTK